MRIDLMKSFFNCLLCLAALGVCGCQSPDEQLDRQFETVSEQYSYFTELPERYESLNWETAAERLMAANLNVTQAYNGLLEAAEAKQRIFLDLVPSLSVTANLSEELTNLGNLSSEDLNFGIFSSVNIPGLIRLRARYFYLKDT